MGKGVSSSVEDALKAAAAESSVRAGAEGVGEKFSPDDVRGDVPRDGSWIPRDRLNELNEKWATKVAELEDKLQGQTGTQAELQRQLAAHQDLIQRIRGLADDDRYKDAVVKIDKALRGVEDDIKESLDEDVQKAKDAGDTKLVTELKKQREELLDEIANERARSLLQTAQDRAARYLESLPEQYDAFKPTIAKLWNNEVDWDAIEENPDVMNEELARALQTVVDDLPVPNINPSDVEIQEVNEELTPEEELRSLLHPELDWAGADEKGNLRVSDEQFEKVLAHSIRLSKAANAAQRGRR